VAVEREVFDIGGHAHFVTFSCYRRRRLLDDNRAKSIVIHFLSEQLRKADGACAGFVIMPDHVHALVHFNQPGMLSRFMQQWKARSSARLKEWIKKHLPAYAAAVDLSEPIWKPRYYGFNVFSQEKAIEKLEYMHDNPVAKGLTNRAEDWMYGSARWYLLKRPVGVEITSIS